MAKIDFTIKDTDRDRVEKKRDDLFWVWVHTGDIKSNEAIDKIVSQLSSGGANLDSGKARMELQGMRGQLSVGATITLTKSIR